MGFADFLKKKIQKQKTVISEFEYVPVNADAGMFTEEEDFERFKKIKNLSNLCCEDSLKNLLEILQYDIAGETSIHASIALACRKGIEKVEETISSIYNEAPVMCAPGYPPEPGNGVFPKVRLLYPFVWMNKPQKIKSLLDNSGSWPGANQGKKYAYELAEVTGAQNFYEAAKKICFMEYLDEKGRIDMMELTGDYYPQIIKDKGIWSCVRCY